MRECRCQLLVVFAMVAFSCSQDGSGPSEPASFEFSPEMIGDHAAGAAFSFTFDYRAPPPQGRLFHSTSVSGVQDPCSLFKGTAAPRNFNALSVTAGATTHGSYLIRRTDEGLAEDEGYLEWIEVRDGAVVGKARAISGVIELVSGPQNEEEWGQPARVSVSAEFELDPVVRSECEGGEDMTSGVVTVQCQCVRSSGTEFYCDGKNGWCCQDEVGDVSSVAFSFEAKPCAEQCSFTSPSLSGYCRDLL